MAPGPFRARPTHAVFTSARLVSADRLRASRPQWNTADGIPATGKPAILSRIQGMTLPGGGIMNDYQGVIIEESLESKGILENIDITSTQVEQVTDKHQTPWLSQWILHTVAIPESEAQSAAEEISRSIDRRHGGAWYADFKNDTYHYIIFRDKIFYVDRSSREQYGEAKKYGISLGIPEHQVDFHPDVEEWER